MPTSADLASELSVLDDDIAELQSLQAAAKRPAVIASLRTLIAEKSQQADTLRATLDTNTTAPPPPPRPHRAEPPQEPQEPQEPPRPRDDEPQPPPRQAAVAAAPAAAEPAARAVELPADIAAYAPLRKFAWDQSDKFVTVYCDLPGLAEAAEVDCRFNVTSFTFFARGVAGKNWTLAVPALCEKISPGRSMLKRKEAKFVLKLAKLQQGVEWSGLDDAEKRRQEQHKALVDSGASTEELLANMYRNADDKTREELSKAAHQGRIKREADNKAKGF